jgi:hypothetical protein
VTRRDLFAAVGIAATGVAAWVSQPRAGLDVSVESVRYPLALAGFVFVMYLLGRPRRSPRRPILRRNRAFDYARIDPAGLEVIRRAQREAVALGKDWLGPEHLLLGLLGNAPSPATRLLELRGVELDATRARLEEAAGRGDEPVTPPINLHPLSWHVINHAIRRAARARPARLADELDLLDGVLASDQGWAIWLLIKAECSIVELRGDIAGLAVRPAN